MKFSLTIDQSTSATKALLFDDNIALISRVSIEHKQFYPQPRWVEHDPGEILTNTYKSVKLLLEKNKISPSDIQLVAITNHRETVVLISDSLSYTTYINKQLSENPITKEEKKTKYYLSYKNVENQRIKSVKILNTITIKRGVQWY